MTNLLDIVDNYFLCFLQKHRKENNFEERVGGQTPLTDFLVEMKTPGVKDAHAGLLDAGLAFFKAGKKCVPKSLRNSQKIPLI